jgi:O-antigen/teichoic acid export membrane protein
MYRAHRAFRRFKSSKADRQLAATGFLHRAGMVFIGQGGQAASSFLLTIVVSRAVSPSIRGEFVLLTLIPQIGTYLVTLGLPGAVMRGVAAEENERPPLLAISAFASLGAGILLTAATPLLMNLMHSTSPPILLVFGGTTALTWVIFASWFAFGSEQFLLAGILRTAPILGAALMIVALDALGHAGLVTMFVPWAGLHLLTALGSAVYFFRRYGFVVPRRKQVFDWVHYGIRYSAIQILDLVTLRFDQIILGWLGTTAAVGFYSVGVSLSESILLAPTAVGLIVFLDSAKSEIGIPFRRKLVTTVLVSCLAIGILALVAHPLIELLFGGRYRSAVSLTRILAIGTPGLVTLRLVTNRLSGAGKPGTASIYALVVFGATTGLDLLLIPRYGATGAAWASAIGYNLGGAAAVITMRRVGVPEGLPNVASQSTQPPHAPSTVLPSDSRA